VSRSLWIGAFCADPGRRVTIFGARIGYQHWWTAELRSTVDFSMEHADISSFCFGDGASDGLEQRAQRENDRDQNRPRERRKTGDNNG
jgi:hypothetical protein